MVLFFVIGFCAESVDIKSEFRFEAMLRMLIRLGIAQWLVANSLTILKAFFSSTGAMVKTKEEWKRMWKEKVKTGINSLFKKKV